MRQHRYRIERVAVATAMRVVPWMGRRTLMGVAKFLGNLGWALDARGRRTTSQNLRFAFGETPPCSSRAVYQSVARTFLELFWSSNLTPEIFHELVEEVTDPPELASIAKEQPSILVCPHFGNFEWLPHSQAYTNERTLLVLAQDFKNPMLTPLFVNMREHSGHTFTSTKGGLLKLMRHLKRGGATALLTDLTVPPNQAATVVNCFGGATSATAAHVELARRTGAVLEPHIMIPLAGGKYRDVRGAPVAVEGRTNAEAAQECWDFFERHMRESPEAWLWMYKHWRYLPQDTGAKTFPEYANRSKKFDKLMARERG